MGVVDRKIFSLFTSNFFPHRVSNDFVLLRINTHWMLYGISRNYVVDDNCYIIDWLMENPCTNLSHELLLSTCFHGTFYPTERYNSYVITSLISRGFYCICKCQSKMDRYFMCLTPLVFLFPSLFVNGFG